MAASLTQRRRKRFAVGQIWEVHRTGQPAGCWHFRVVAETIWEGQPYYVALKCGVRPDSLQAVVFNQYGESVEAGPFAYDFVCIKPYRGLRAPMAG